jgi:pimeloyl-ACP methyl ester carboxylesterase
MFPSVTFSNFRIALVALVFISTVPNASGQEFRAFTEALAVPDCHAYGREALYRDQLALQLYHGTLVPPRAGAPAPSNLSGEDQVWNAIKAEEDGKFRGEVIRSGYLYIRFESDAERIALLLVTGHNMLYLNGEPRMGDLYSYGYMRLPVKIRRGVNEIFIQSGRFSARTGISAGLAEVDRPVGLLVDDATLPMVLPGDLEPLWAAVRVINATERPLEGLTLRAVAGGRVMEEALPPVPALSLRKVPFRFDPSQVNQPGQVTLRLELMRGSRVIGEAELTLTAAAPGAHYSRTFVSEIDGSVQYYSVAPQTGAPSQAPALFLSVHGAEVEAISQARAYRPKDWGVLVAPTNRRPRGFNWEDWGRMDALEVLDIAIREFNPDPKRIYLTGHSMGGHGTWYLGATYPDRFAAIAPCAGYPTLSSYGSHDGRIPSRRQPFGRGTHAAPGEQSQRCDCLVGELPEPRGVHLSRRCRRNRAGGPCPPDAGRARRFSPGFLLLRIPRRLPLVRERKRGLGPHF